MAGTVPGMDGHPETSISLEWAVSWTPFVPRVGVPGRHKLGEWAVGIYGSLGVIPGWLLGWDDSS